MIRLLKLKRLFWVSILLILLSSCVTNSTVVKDSLYYGNLVRKEESVENRYNYIYALYSEGEYKKIIEEALQGADLYPTYTRFTKIKALSYQKLGDSLSYSSSLLSVLEREPYSEELIKLYLESLIEIGEKERAYSYSREVLTLFPDNTTAIKILSEVSQFYNYLNTLNEENAQSQL